ncbi:hypothetical protein [Nocardia vinacea]|uniref:hypothetical protein n=1 Tax=Nocardia vinacea TaxID=96468 RepID=UPI0002D5CD77|nr:hypothetical protein [Nocardia vinacea]
MLLIQCGLAVGLAISLTIALAPELSHGLGTLGWKLFGTAFLLGLIVAVALNPIVRYVRMLWRDDHDN